MSFAPRLDALPEAQRALWADLKQVPRKFVLYGGTALALRLGHRQSEDFDFFGDAPVAPAELLRTIPLLKNAEIRQMTNDTLTVSVYRPEPVKLSFFGLTCRRVKDPDPTDDGVVRVASLLDIAGFKMAVLPQRAEPRDYLDVHALLKAGVSVEQALGAASAIYGSRFNPMLTLKALGYFADGELPSLPADVKNALRAASATRHLDDFEPLPGGIVPPE